MLYFITSYLLQTHLNSTTAAPYPLQALHTVTAMS